ncbi:phage holin family protein [Clostridium omnivorum]|uniref:Holin n=1 Tax=Clostridium omnivorum TaxID=1604902 RepID=A0ABQ5N5N7_9CLOT|nr:phage holin family protein [Clostridium sp. E14]GLC30429.1 hypothetical protein bsdE14_18390 [Clostridium sp. E14]
MDIMKFIIEQAYILVPALYVIGMILKTSSVKDKYIPLILLAFGIVGAIALMGLSVQSIIQGILVTGAAVFTNQLIKQTKKEE